MVAKISCCPELSKLKAVACSISETCLPHNMEKSCALYIGLLRHSEELCAKIAGECFKSQKHKKNTFSKTIPLHSKHFKMNARSFTKVIRSPLARQIANSPAAQRRTIVSALRAAARPTVAAAVTAGPAQQTRGVKTVDFAGHKEQVFGELPVSSIVELILILLCRACRLAKL